MTELIELLDKLLEDIDFSNLDELYDKHFIKPNLPIVDSDNNPKFIGNNEFSEYLVKLLTLEKDSDEFNKLCFLLKFINKHFFDKKKIHNYKYEISEAIACVFDYVMSGFNENKCLDELDIKLIQLVDLNAFKYFPYEFIYMIINNNSLELFKYIHRNNILPNSSIYKNILNVYKYSDSYKEYIGKDMIYNYSGDDVFHRTSDTYDDYKHFLDWISLIVDNTSIEVRYVIELTWIKNKNIIEDDMGKTEQIIKID